jgi:sensor histidine kinase YesM
MIKFYLEVKDDGIGFTPQKLADIQEELEDTSGKYVWKVDLVSEMSING